jgi:hypothetical protein
VQDDTRKRQRLQRLLADDPETRLEELSTQACRRRDARTALCGDDSHLRDDERRSRIRLDQCEASAGAEDPTRFAQRPHPIGQMVQEIANEDRIEHAVSEREASGVPRDRERGCRAACKTRLRRREIETEELRLRRDCSEMNEVSPFAASHLEEARSHSEVGNGAGHERGFGAREIRRSRLPPEMLSIGKASVLALFGNEPVCVHVRGVYSTTRME